MIATERYYPRSVDERNHILFMLKLGARLEWRHTYKEEGPWSPCNPEKEAQYLAPALKHIRFDSWNDVEYRHMR